MNGRRSQKEGGKLNKKASSREEAIPEMSCVVHKHQELSSQVEHYKNTPELAFELPATTHHWLICQNAAGPKHFLVQVGETEHKVGGLNEQQMIYIPPGTKTQWDFTSAKGSTHLLIPDKLLLETLSDEGDFAKMLGQGPLCGALMPRLSGFIHSRRDSLSLEANPSDLVLSEFILGASEVLAQELLAQHKGQKPPVVARENLSRKALQFVEDFMWDNIERNITLAELAKLVHLSPYYFSRSFKKETQTTPHQALLQLRVRRARILLPKAKTLTEIAYLCGFSDQSHFTRVFKKHTGFTPRQFREQTGWHGKS